MLLNISRNKCNQTMKFSPLKECNMGNVSLEKLFTECGGEPSPRPFSKRSKLKISLD